MSKRPNESKEERKARKARKKAKKEKKRSKLEKKNTSSEKDGSVAATGVILSNKEQEWNSFQEAPFEQPIQKALTDAGFAKPSEIQARAWPAAVGGQDLVAVAKTGSGKTLGFLLPVFHRISTHNLPDGANVPSSSKIPSPLCLVLSPTRELASQIEGECSKFGTPIGISSACVYGGTNLQDQIKELKKIRPKVLVATPGRLCDLLEREALSLLGCPFVVLDEADRMLDMGFEPQLKKITAALPDKSLRQTLFFTATWPKSVRRVASSFLRDKNTTEIFLGEGTADGELVANKAVTQRFVEAQDDQKDRKLYDILCGLDQNAAVVIFANTKRRVDFVAKIFWQEGFATCSVHGDKQQRERDEALANFTKKQFNILVATDVAARGLDLKGVTHVINFDMARDVESYVHRIGRTGRAGEIGEAITFWNPDYDKDCSPALVKIARDAGQAVPPFLAKYENLKASKQWKVADAAKAVTMLTSASN